MCSLNYIELQTKIVAILTALVNIRIVLNFLQAGKITESDYFKKLRYTEKSI